MKIKLVIIGLLFSLFSFSQIQDLAKLANGKIIYSSTLYDSNNKLYGYIYLYEQEVNKEINNIEYVLLDKNLNKVLNNTFKEKKYYGTLDEYNCTLSGDNIILNKDYYYQKNRIEFVLLLSTFRTISISKNTTSEELKYQNGIFSTVDESRREMFFTYYKLKTKSYINPISSSEFNGLIVSEKTNKKKYLEKEIKMFNESNEQVWTYKYNSNGSKKSYKTYSFLYSNKDRIYISTPTWGKNFLGKLSIVSYNIIALDIKTGKKEFDYLLENKESDYSHILRLREVGDNLELTGNYSPYKSTDFDIDDNLGFYKITIDKNGKELDRKYTEWENFNNLLDINKYGRIGFNYRLKPIKYFFFQNGAISILTQKSKVGSISNLEKEREYVLFNMKPDFSVDTVYTIKKEAADDGNVYLFSNYLKEGSEAVFFYKTYVSDPRLFSSKNDKILLGINTIKDGRLKQEQIQLSAKKKYIINPNPAKEGYIMLQEYNEEDKYNQIRLEKLNQ